MQKVIALLVMLSLAGCVSVQHAGNWRPQHGSVSSDYYQCLRESQQAQTSATQYYAQASAKTDEHMLSSCMSAHGYRLRQMTTGEIIAALVLSPIWVPMSFLVLMSGGSTGVLGPNDKAP